MPSSRDSGRYDVVVVGAGIAGSAAAVTLARSGASVLLLERQSEFRDLVRGEFLSPWGVAEAQRLGLDQLLREAGAWPLVEWVQWDETVEPDEAMGWDLSTFVPGVVPLSLSHRRTCVTLAQAAVEAGAELHTGVELLEVRAGAMPSVTYSENGGERQVECGLVLGAGGRGCPVGRQIGLRLESTVHHWGAGLAVTGLDDWPEDLYGMGTEGDAMFFVMPQGEGHARLYLNFAASDRHRFAGYDGARRFIEAMNFDCLPYAESLMKCEPAGPCASYPSGNTWTDDPTDEGVVLIGDEAGANDPVLGTGLSNALRDVRLVSEALGSERPFDRSSFGAYVDERRERMRRLRFCADVVGRLSAEFGPEAVERRRLAWQRIRRTPELGVFLLASMSGPESVPEFAFSPFFSERLFSPG